MKTKKYTFSSIALFVVISLPNITFAEDMKIELGWGNITPCSRTTSVPSSIPGIPAPKVEFAEQRIHAYANISAMTSTQDVVYYIQQCAVKAAGAAGISAIIASPAAAMPTFQSAFYGCLQNIGNNIIDFSLSVEPECLWQ